MGLRNDRLSRLRDAIAAWRQKIENERAAAEATARAEREAAENARELAEKTKAETDTATHLSELASLDTDIETLVASVQTHEATIATALTATAAATTSTDAATQRDIIIAASASITRLINDISVKKAALEIAYSNLKKSTDDYDSLDDEFTTGRTDYLHALSDIAQVDDSKKDAESAVSTAVTKVSTLIASEAAAQAEAARLAAIQQAENDRLAALLAKATADVTMYLGQVQTFESDIATIVASLDTASATVATNKTAAGNATASADAIAARDNIATQSANITVLVNTLGQKAAALETAFGNLTTAAGTYSSLQDELTTGTTAYNNAQDDIQSVSTAKKDAETQLAYASNAAQTLLASEAAAQAAADAAAAQAAAELEAARVASEAEAAAIAAAEAKKTEAMQYTDTAIAGLIDSAPGTLDTLNELAAALGDDPNFAATVTSQLTNLDNQKVDKINTTGKTVGSSTAIPVITYNNQGQITSASTTAITVGNGAMSVTAGSGLSGGGQVGTANQTGSSSVTISHADTSSVTNIDTSGKVVIDALTFDTYGHVTGATSRTLDFYTTSEADGRYVNVAGDTMTGTLSFSNTASERKIDLNGNNAHLIGWESYHNTYGPGTWSSGTIGHKFFGAANSITAVIGTGGNPGSKNSVFYGNITAPTFIGALTGNASSATHAGRWTTARNNNINLTGDVTGYGSASVDGTGNWTVTVNTTVGNDSHTHDGRYYTKSEADGRYTRSDYINSGYDWNTFDYGSNEAVIARVESSAANPPISGVYNWSLYQQGDSTRGSQIAVSAYAGGNKIFYRTSNLNTGWHGWSRVFDDIYHPNADKWTTARTLSLTGDVTGSVSIDGSGNVSMTTAVANDSHTHSNYVAKTGDTMTGQLTVNTSGSNNAIRLYTEASTAQIGDTFAAATHKNYIYFDQGTSSNDPGYIMHETSSTETNEGVIHLCPTDDNTGSDYISIHGTNDADSVRIYTDGRFTGVASINGGTPWHSGNLNPASYVSYYEGTSPPTTNGTLWLNTATGKTYQRQRGVWVQIAPGVGGIAIYDVNGTKVN